VLIGNPLTLSVIEIFAVPGALLGTLLWKFSRIDHSPSGLRALGDRFSQPRGTVLGFVADRAVAGDGAAVFDDRPFGGRGGAFL
jgi:hypothetical protein